MTEPFQRLRRFLRELKRRNVYKVAVAYVAVAFVGIQAADLLVPQTTLPAYADNLLIYLAVFGFPIALVVAWAFEMTPEGVRRTSAAGPEGAIEEEPVPSAGGTRAAYKVLVGLGLVAAVVAGGWYLLGGGGETSEVSEGTVAVLPFQVSGSGAETWQDGMVTVLTTKLDGTAGLRAIADRTVLAAWEERGRGGDGASTLDALGVARQVGAEYAVVGSAVQLGEELRFTASLHETRSQNRIGQVEVVGAPDSVTALTDSLARRTLGVLAQEMGQEFGSAGLASLTTRSLPALRAYLEGERHFRSGDYAEAARHYETAVGLDSSFALPWTRLQSARWWSAQYEGVFPAIERAYAMSDRLPRRERRIVRARYLWVPQRRHLAARDSLRRLTNAYPDDPTVWYWLGEVVYHGSVPGGWVEAEEALDRAIELDPGVPQYHHHFVELAFALRHDSALAAERTAAHPPGDHKEMYRLAADLVFGDGEERTQALDRIDRLPVPTLYQLTNTLRHPTDGRLEERVLRRILEREEVEDSRYRHKSLVNSLERGRVRKGVAQIEGTGQVAGAAEEAHLARPSCYLSLSMTLGTPVPDSIADSMLDPGNIEEPAPAARLMCSAFYLIEQDRLGELPELFRRIRASGAAQGLTEAQIDAKISEVKGYRAWREGRLDRAADLWEKTDEAGIWGAIWRGHLYQERGQMEKAEDWYMAAWRHPVAHESLGRLYERMDRPEDAAAAYRRFVTAWQDADPELQDRVEAARERLEQLTASEADTDE